MKTELVKSSGRKIVLAGLGYFPGGSTEKSVQIPETIEEAQNAFDNDTLLSFIQEGITSQASSSERPQELIDLIQSSKKMVSAMLSGMPNADKAWVNKTFLGLPTPSGKTMEQVLADNGFVEDETAGSDDKRITKAANDADTDEEEEEVID